MKKLLAFILGFCMVFSLCACGSGSSSGSTATDAASSSDSSVITIVKGEKKADTRRLMALMGLGIKQGETITVQAEGPDEEKAAAEILRYLTENRF